MRERSLARRLGPLAAGAAVMLVATTIVTFVRPADDSELTGPTVNAALSAADTAAAVRRIAPTTATPEASASPAPTVLAPAPAPTTQAPPKPAVEPPKPAARPSNSGGSGGSGVQAAAAKGWTLVGGDEFNSGMSDTWGPYDGAGHSGNGRRSSDALSVENGALVIRGDSNGTTGGMAWGDDQRFGKWELRAKFPKGDSQYHPVLLLWPNGSWPSGGEVDFAETDSAADDVAFFLHYSSSNQQKYAHKTLDITQWHNYAVEWVDGRITGYIDGEEWFESTDRGTLPPDQMHAAIQLDYFPDGGSPEPTEMLVDYMRIYK